MRYFESSALRHCTTGRAHLNNHRLFALVAVVASAGYLSGCGSDDPTSLAGDGDAKVLVVPTMGHNDSMKQFKVLEVNDRGCIRASSENPNGGEPFVGVLGAPDGVKVTGGADDFEVRFTGSDYVVSEGDAFPGGGAVTVGDSEHGLDETEKGVVEAAQKECGEDVVVWVTSGPRNPS